MLKKKILIIGGTGFIGYHLAQEATRRNWTVHSLSKKKPKNIRVSYSEESKEIVARLFHYRNPILKMIYEIIIMIMIIFENIIKKFLSIFN